MKPPKPLITTIHPLLAKRWSPRSFTGEPVNDMKLLQLFEAARWSPSAFNEQPWHFIYADNRSAESFNSVHSCLNEGNQTWTKKASVLILTFAKKQFDRNGKENQHAQYDLGGAMANLTIQALDQGLFVHQMAGINREFIKEKYKIPTGWEPVTAVAIGFLADPDGVEEKHRANETATQKRNDIKEIAAMDKWHNTDQSIKF
jgi:nitroreductase